MSFSLFRSVLSSVLNFDTFWVNSSICLIFVNFCLARNGKIFFYVVGVFECLREANYRKFCHPQGRSRGPSKQLQAIQHGNFRGKHYVVFFSRISFSWVFHPFFALTWTSRDFFWIKNCRKRSFCQLSSFKMCFLSKCSEHICKFFTDSNSLSAPRQRFSNSFQASPCSENRKN